MINPHIWAQPLPKTILLSGNEQDTSHKMYMRHGSLADNLILVSKKFFTLSYYFCFIISSSMKLGSGQKH